MTKSKRELVQAYRALCNELSGILYEEDPAGIGKSIGTPDDEYDSEAADLASALKDATSREQIERVVLQTFRATSPALVARVERAVTQFRMKTAS